MLQGGFPSLGLAVHSPPSAHDALDLSSATGPADAKQPFLGFWRGDAREGADLCVRQSAAGESLSQARQRSEGTGHADALASSAQVETDAS
jgi:hypothetical protein